MSILTLDGSYGEGGGQILRTALALSMLTKKPFKVADIRSGRKNPGLKQQHFHAIKALEQLSNAKSENAYVGSDWISFFPSEITQHDISIDVGTAGSITLLLQALLLPAMFAKNRIKISIRGGTDVAWSTPVDYFSNVLLPHLRRYADIDFKILRRGYYPKGGELVEIAISPKISCSDFKDFDEFLNKARTTGRIELSEKGKLIAVKGVSHASSELQKASVCERQAESAVMALKKLGCPTDIKSEYCSAESIGSGICVFALFSNNDESEEFDAGHPIILGADSLGERGKPAEKVGFEAANALIAEINSGACADCHSADQLIPFLALFGGSIKTSKITEHLKTNIYVVEQFLGKTFMIQEPNRIIKTLF